MQEQEPCRPAVQFLQALSVQVDEMPLAGQSALGNDVKYDLASRHKTYLKFWVSLIFFFGILLIRATLLIQEGPASILKESIWILNDVLEDGLPI